MRYDNAPIGFDVHDGILKTAFENIEGHTLKEVGFVVLSGVWCFTIDSETGTGKVVRSVFPFSHGMSSYPATKSVMNERIVLYGNDSLSQAFRSLSGQSVKKIGFLKVDGVDHLVVDSDDNRLVICFCDLGMSVRWRGKVGVQTAKDKLLNDIDVFIGKMKGPPYVEEDPRRLSYTLVDYESGAEVVMTLQQLKSLPEDCHQVKASLSAVEKDPEEILEALMEVYARTV